MGNRMATMLAVAIAGCGGSGTGAPPARVAGQPPSLLGVWRHTVVSADGYVDSTTGKYWSASADSISITITPGGQLTDTLLSTSALYDCHVSILKMYQGTVTVQGDQLTIDFNHNTEHGEGNCPMQAYDKTWPEEVDHWTWQVLAQDPPQLVLTDAATHAEIGRFDFQPGGQ